MSQISDEFEYIEFIPDDVDSDLHPTFRNKQGYTDQYDNHSVVVHFREIHPINDCTVYFNGTPVSEPLDFVASLAGSGQMIDRLVVILTLKNRKVETQFVIRDLYTYLM